MANISPYAFIGCININSIVVGNKNKKYDSRENCNAIIDTETNTLIMGSNATTIPNSITSIGEDAFLNCVSLNSLYIGSNVTEISPNALAGCAALESITWNCKNYPNCGTETTPFYKSNGFDLRPHIKSFTFGDSVQYIPAHLCDGMENLTSVTIGNNVTSIGKYAFSDCAGLTSVVWNAKLCGDFGNSDSAPFSGSGTQITSFTFSDSIEHIPAYLCLEMENLTSITIPNSVMSIGGNAFNGCTSITSITIPKSVTKMGDGAFSDCTGLTSVVWNAKSCGDFGNSDSAPFSGSGIQITSFTFSDSVEHIPAYLCHDLEKLTAITISNYYCPVNFRFSYKKWLVLLSEPANRCNFVLSNYYCCDKFCMRLGIIE